MNVLVDNNCFVCSTLHLAVDTIHTVWPEILAGRYFGGIYFGAVEPVLAIMIFIAKWLIERAGNLTGP